MRCLQMNCKMSLDAKRSLREELARLASRAPSLQQRIQKLKQHGVDVITASNILERNTHRSDLLPVHMPASQPVNFKVKETGTAQCAKAIGPMSAAIGPRTAVRGPRAADVDDDNSRLQNPAGSETQRQPEISRNRLEQPVTDHLKEKVVTASKPADGDRSQMPGTFSKQTTVPDSTEEDNSSATNQTHFTHSRPGATRNRINQSGLSDSNCNYFEKSSVCDLSKIPARSVSQPGSETSKTCVDQPVEQPRAATSDKRVDQPDTANSKKSNVPTSTSTMSDQLQASRASVQFRAASDSTDINGVPAENVSLTHPRCPVYRSDETAVSEANATSVPVSQPPVSNQSPTPYKPDFPESAEKDEFSTRDVSTPPQCKDEWRMDDDVRAHLLDLINVGQLPTFPARRRYRSNQPRQRFSIALDFEEALPPKPQRLFSGSMTNLATLDEKEDLTVPTKHCVTLKTYQLLLLSELYFKENMEQLHHGLTISINSRTKEIIFKGEWGSVQDAAFVMYRQLNTARSTIISMSEAQLDLLEEHNTQILIKHKFKAEHIVAVWQRSTHSGQTSLGVYATSDQDARRASEIIVTCVIERKCHVPSGCHDLTRSNELHSLLQTLKDVHKGKVQFSIPKKGTHVVVTATRDIIDVMMREVTDFVQHASTSSVLLEIPAEKLRFVSKFAMGEVLALKEVRVSVVRDGLRVSGASKAIDVAVENVKNIVSKIVYGEYLLTDEFDIRFLNDARWRAELLCLESSKRCVVSYDPDTVGAQMSTTGVDRAPPVAVTCVKGEIAKQKVDMIVNSVPAGLKLNSGAVSSSILKAAGPDLQRDLISQYPNGITPGTAIYTGGHRLPCRQVCHMQLLEWAEGAVQVLRRLVISCLMEANRQGFKSVAFPALGTGGLHYPPYKVARTIMDAVRDFHKDVPNTTLRDVRIVIHHSDTYAFQIFELAQQQPVTQTEGNSTAATREKILRIYASSKQAGTDVMTAIDEILDRHIMTLTVKEKFVVAMTANETQEIENICRLHGVCWKYRKGQCVLRGLRNDVLQAHVQIKDLLHSVKLSAVQRQHESMVQRLVQWYYAKVDGSLVVETEHSLSDNYHIEQAYKAKADATDLSMTTDGENYQTVVVDFKAMKQYPTSNPRDTWDIIRRDKIAETAPFRLPDSWSSSPDIRVALAESSHEYSLVTTNFGNKQRTIRKIERIQNPTMWRQYKAAKDRLDKHNPGLTNEMTLWHGTHPEAVDRIMQRGFNRSYCGRNATRYGEGVYFAVSSDYSVKFSDRAQSGHRFVFQCKVLVGYAAKGDADMRFLPDRLNGVPFDSATDDVNFPSMYIIFNDNQAYPEYLITFK